MVMGGGHHPAPPRGMAQQGAGHPSHHPKNTLPTRAAAGSALLTWRARQSPPASAASGQLTPRILR